MVQLTQTCVCELRYVAQLCFFMNEVVQYDSTRSMVHMSFIIVTSSYSYTVFDISQSSQVTSQLHNNSQLYTLHDHLISS